MIKAILYDVGGVLYTSYNDDELRLDFAKRLLLKLRELGMDLNVTAEVLDNSLTVHAREYKTYAEDTMRELPSIRIWKDYFLRDFDVDEEKLLQHAEELSFYYDSARVRMTPRSHLKETLHTLHEMGIRQAIANNIMSTTFVPYFTEKNGISPYFQFILMSSQIGVRKPDSGIFHMAAERLGVLPGECAYVGDTISRDVRGVRNAGLAMMIKIDNPAVAYKDAAFIGKGFDPDYEIKDLSEIPGIIRSCNGR
jgi:putative hydrolase of the HAD superfamily